MVWDRDSLRGGLADMLDLASTRTGWVASGAGHFALVIVLIFGGLFSRSSLPPFEVAEVTVISEEEFAQLLRPEQAPEAGQGLTAPEPPRAPPTSPPPPSRPQIAEPAPEPAPPSPGTPELTAPPQVETPTRNDPAPEAAPRIAPEAAPAPPVEAETAPTEVEQVAVEPDAEPDQTAEARDAAAPPEAATEIVTEAEQPSGAPDTPIRPRARPDRIAQIDPGSRASASSIPEPEPEPEPQPEPQPEPTPEPQPAEPAPAEDPLAAAVAAAVAEAVSNTPAGAPDTGAAAGPPLSQGERDAFRVAVERCWIVDPGSPAASVTVIVGMRMTRDAKPDTASIQMVGSQGGDDSAVRTAFEAARRAIIRCGAEGYPLPADRYDRWSEVEMTFNPEGMRVR